MKDLSWKHAVHRQPAPWAANRRAAAGWSAHLDHWAAPPPHWRGGLRPACRARGTPRAPRFCALRHDDHESDSDDQEAAALVEAGDGTATRAPTPEGDLITAALAAIRLRPKQAAQHTDRRWRWPYPAFYVCRSSPPLKQPASWASQDHPLTEPRGCCVRRASLIVCGTRAPDARDPGRGGHHTTAPALVKAPVLRHDFSGKKELDSRMQFRREGVPMGLPGFSRVGGPRQHRAHHPPGTNTGTNRIKDRAAFSAGSPVVFVMQLAHIQCGVLAILFHQLFVIADSLISHIPTITSYPDGGKAGAIASRCGPSCRGHCFLDQHLGMKYPRCSPRPGS